RLAAEPVLIGELAEPEVQHLVDPGLSHHVPSALFPLSGYRHPHMVLDSSFLNRVTSRPADAVVEKLRYLADAAVELERAAGMEGAAGGRIDGVRDLAFDALARPAGHFEVGHGVEQHARIGMLRLPEQGLCLGHL